MPWKTTSSDFVTSSIKHAMSADVAALFDNYERIGVEFNMNPNCVATKHGLTFTSFSPKNNQIDALSKIEHKDEVTEVAWLSNGKVCWTKTEGPIEVGTGLPRKLIEYGEQYGTSGPYKSPQILVWDVFRGLVDNEEVVMVLDNSQKYRALVSPIMPLIYAGFDAVCDQYDLEDLKPVDLLTLGWANLLMLVPEASSSDLMQYLLQASHGTASAITKALLKKAKEDVLNPYDDYDQEFWKNENGLYVGGGGP